jgi:taurine--2-oxoglutarate transaminase
MGEMLTELADRHPSIGDVRSIGLFGALDLVKNKKTREPVSPYGKTCAAMAEFRQKCLENGLFLYTHWQNVLIIPPLIITEDKLAEGMSILDTALNIVDRETVL